MFGMRCDCLCNRHGDDMNEPTFSRPQAATGGIPAGESIRARSAAMLDWRSVSPTEAGFADNMEERLDKAVAEKRIWNLHSVIVVRNGRLVLERYFDSEDDARGKPLGVVSFKPDTLHDLRSASKSIVGLLYGIALAAGKVPSPDQPLMQSFPEPMPIADAGPCIMSCR